MQLNTVLFTHPVCINTVCTSSLDPFYTVNYYTNWVKTSWVHSAFVSYFFTLSACRLKEGSRIEMQLSGPVKVGLQLNPGPSISMGGEVICTLKVECPSGFERNNRRSKSYILQKMFCN